MYRPESMVRVIGETWYLPTEKALFGIEIIFSEAWGCAPYLKNAGFARQGSAVKQAGVADATGGEAHRIRRSLTALDVKFSAKARRAALVGLRTMSDNGCRTGERFAATGASYTGFGDTPRRQSSTMLKLTYLTIKGVPRTPASASRAATPVISRSYCRKISSGKWLLQ